MVTVGPKRVPPFVQAVAQIFRYLEMIGDQIELIGCHLKSRIGINVLHGNKGRPRRAAFA